MSESNIMPYVSLLSLISVMIVFRRFFALIALGDVDLHFSLILITKANIVVGELHHPRDYTTSVINPHT